MLLAKDFGAPFNNQILWQFVFVRLAVFIIIYMQPMYDIDQEADRIW